MLSRVAFSQGESEPEWWGLTEAGLTQWPGGPSDRAGRQPVQKVRTNCCRTLTATNQTERGSRAWLTDPKTTHEYGNLLSGCQSISKCTCSQGRQTGVGDGAADLGCGVFFTSAKHHCWWAGQKPPPSQLPHATALDLLTLLLGAVGEQGVRNASSEGGNPGGASAIPVHAS